MKFNIDKLIKSVKNSQFLLDTLKTSNINFIQFFVRVLVDFDPKNYLDILVGFIDNGYVLMKDSSTQEIYNLNSDIRALVMSELTTKLFDNKDKIVDLIENKRIKGNVKLSFEEIFTLRTFTSYSSILIFLSSFVEGIKTEWNKRGEMSLNALIKFY